LAGRIGRGRNKAGKTRTTGAAFLPEGGIIFLPTVPAFHAAVQRNSLLFFFSGPCRKN
jgi:hypothetical protein